jgi:hypothetical protein
VLNIIVPLAGFPTFKAERKMRFQAHDPIHQVYVIIAGTTDMVQP